LHCISKYPTPLKDVNLDQINFEKYFGFSDHTVGITASCAALSRGAKIIEKHFTLDKEMFGPDHVCSMSPNELLQLSIFRDELEVCL
jgi:sialic acid synthase SpsE